jgi:hypothetical protein
VRTRTGAALVLAAVAGAMWPSPARADRVTGEVVSVSSHWARGGRDIVTEAVLLEDDGARVTVRQLGGSVDGIGMVVVHGPRLVRAGERVAAEVEVVRDLSGRERRVVRGIRGAREDGGGDGEVMDFVRTPATKTGVPLAWESSCAMLWYHEGGTTHLPDDRELDVMHDAVGRWRTETAGCSYFTIDEQGARGGEVGLDMHNLVLFRADRWCRPGTVDDPEECYDPNAAGLTTLFFIDDDSSDRNGAILDADIELNGVNFAISDGGDSTEAGCQSDLGNTFTHELGHLQGLDHTCFTNGARLQDDEGDPQPSCSGDLPADITEATMYNFQDCGETKKASLEADDIEGICAIYPAADDPGACTAPELDEKGCGCASSAGSGNSVLLVLFVLIAGARLRWGARGEPLD